MKEAFKQIPKPLQKQILYRLGMGVIALIMSVTFVISKIDLLSVLACFSIVTACFVSSGSLFRRAILGEYLIILGMCQAVKFTSVRKRTKMITLQTDDGQMLQVFVRQHLKKIVTGSIIMLYVAPNMHVYDKDIYFIHSFLALEIRNK